MPFTPPHLLGKQWSHLRIGIFGGTFNPPHSGHLHVCDVAFKTGKFDFIWWMVTPGNPLKRHKTASSFEQRLLWSQNIVTHPRMLVTDIEQQLNTHKSIDTIRALKRHFPLTHFTFIAGTDNTLSLHKWEEWRTLLQEIPFLFIGRPPALDLIRKAPVKLLKNKNIEWILETKLVHQSSTLIRTQQTTTPFC